MAEWVVDHMDDASAFMDEVLPQMRVADTALHSGDPAGRIGMWSQVEPLTLFGAAVTKSGWTDIRATFEWLGTTFRDCASFSIEVVAAEVSGDLGYIAAIERTTASVDGRPPGPYALRVTTIFRRESDQWKVVHRHGDPMTDDARNIAALRDAATRAAEG